MTGWVSGTVYVKINDRMETELELSQDAAIQLDEALIKSVKAYQEHTK